MRQITVLLLMLLISVSVAYRADLVTITPFEYKDFGNTGLPKFDDMKIIMDCNGASIKTHIASSGTPVPGASTLLEYVDYYVPLLSSGLTNSSGDVSHNIPSGNISHMTGIFVLAVEKTGYQRREAHFEISDCFLPEPPPPPPPQNITPPQNVTPPQQNATPPQQNNTPPTPQPENNTAPPPNMTQNASGNQTGTGAGGLSIPFCPASLVLGFLALFAAAQSRR